MNNKKEITLTFDLGQVCDDILAKCNLISTSIRDEALEDIKANVLAPDNPETRSIICRAVTEAFGKVKVACQRYLDKGRTADRNNLERLVKSVTYKKETVEVQDEDDDGHLLYTCTVTSGGSSTDHVCYTTDGGTTWKDVESGSTITPNATPVAKMVEKIVDSDEIDQIEYESIGLVLEIPNFNTAVTDHLKSAIHKYVVDYVMGRFLQDQVADKAAEYKQLADTEGYSDIVSDLNARERYTMRMASWV